MSDDTKIEWTDATWNPVTGCTKVSPGCDNCYAERIVNRFKGKGAFDTIIRDESKLFLPFKWRKPRRVFVNSMSDLFHDDVPTAFIAEVFAVMAMAEQHTFQILTKRHARMRTSLRDKGFMELVQSLAVPLAARFGINITWAERCTDPRYWPLSNVWLGVSVEDQKWADIRIPALLDTPAAVRWLSCEPLLGPVDLTYCAGVNALEQDWIGGPGGGTGAPHPFLDWVIVGGESGPAARPMHPDWARSLRDQCNAANVPYFFKQWGEWAPVPAGFECDRPFRIVPEYAHGQDGPFQSGWAMRRVGKRAAGRDLDGRTWDEYPQVVSGRG